jgi:peptidoglycan/xylan/chitin deacetylase (PgdA/CDA1 family)
VLLYHAVGSAIGYGNDYGMSVQPREFVAQLDALLACELLEPTRIAVPSDGRACVSVSFDDGFADVLDVAVPALVERAMPFSVFMTTDWVGRPGYLSSEGLRELASLDLASIGSHSASHPPLTSLDDRQLNGELVGSRRCLEDTLGIGIESFAYPHGVLDERVRRAVAAAGYAHASTSRYGRNRPTTDRLRLRRCEVVAGDDPATVVAKATGAWDWLGLRRSPRA